MADWPGPFVSSAQLSPNAPVPVSAFLDPGLVVASVTFDSPIVLGPVSIGNWSVQFGSLNLPVTFADVIDPYTIQLDLTTPVFAGSGFFVSYSPPPFDLLGQNMLPVQTFSQAF